MRHTLTLAAALLVAASPAIAAAYSTVLAGANQVPPVVTSATGLADVDIVGDTLSVAISFTGLADAGVFGHIHCCAPLGTNAGVAVPFVGLPASTSGVYAMSYDLGLAATYTGAFLTANGGTALGARDALLAGIAAGQSYVNIHNATYPAGEIRGQLAEVPAPAALSLFGLGALSLAAVRRRG